jgi:hypothetical protein
LLLFIFTDIGTFITAWLEGNAESNPFKISNALNVLQHSRSGLDVIKQEKTSDETEAGFNRLAPQLRCPPLRVGSEKLPTCHHLISRSAESSDGGTTPFGTSAPHPHNPIKQTGESTVANSLAALKELPTALLDLKRFNENCGGVFEPQSMADLYSQHPQHKSINFPVDNLLGILARCPEIGGHVPVEENQNLNALEISTQKRRISPLCHSLPPEPKRQCLQVV